uniref:hypothetical protein n=1 Tax=uncultured Altererythrobacter sp. TaxID=500840 RepID=UPI0026228EB4|nr:hypothetical protein [uncultured Altererythrobacter sp.]
MTQQNIELLWGAAIVIATAGALTLGLDEAGAFEVTMALVAVSLTHIFRKYGFKPDGTE